MASEKTSGPAGTPSERDDEPALAAALRRVNQGLGVAETLVVALSLAALVLVGAYQVLASHFLGENAPWPYEVVRYAVFWIAMFAAALAAQRRAMISMDVVTRALPPARRAALGVATSLVVVVVCAVLFRAALDVRAGQAVMNETYDLISSATGYWALPIGALLIGLHFLLHAISDLAYLVKGRVPPPPGQRAH